MDKEASNESLEESIFKTLSHQTRRDIVRFIGEKKQASFTEIKNSMKIEDSATLSYHLNTLQALLLQRNGKYTLTELGQDAYDLINKTAVSTESASTVIFLRGKIPWVIVANAFLWAAALILTAVFEGLVTYSIISLLALWVISNLLLNTLLKRLGGKSCMW